MNFFHLVPDSARSGLWKVQLPTSWITSLFLQNITNTQVEQLFQRARIIRHRFG